MCFKKNSTNNNATNNEPNRNPTYTSKINTHMHKDMLCTTHNLTSMVGHGAMKTTRVQ